MPGIAPVSTAEADSESRIRLEQTRLIYEMDGSTIFPTLSVAVFLFFALRNAANATALGIWLAVIVATRIGHLWGVRRYLANPATIDGMAAQE